MKNLFKSMLHFFPIVIATAILSGCEKDLSEVKDSVSGSTILKAGTIIQANYYVSPSGNDNNPGSIDKPFKTWDRVLSVVKAGDLVYLRGGTYPRSTRNKGAGCYLANKSGEAGKYIKLWAYPGEKPILDCKDMTIIGGGVGLRLANCNYWHIKGIEIKNVYQKFDPTINRGTDHVGLAITNSNNNIIENVKIHDIGGSGIGVAGSSTKNLIRNCDLYNNYDKYSYSSTGKPYPGGNADGAHITVIKGTSNTIVGCRFFFNSDDGIDLYQNEGTMKIDSCWAFNNGRDGGDGNGFKLGDTFQPKESFPQRLVYHCIAYNNKTHGFDQNNGNVTMVFYNNTSYQNGMLGFYVNKYNLKHTFVNNISFANKKSDLITVESIQKNNSWNGNTVATSDFQSFSSSDLYLPRKANGNLPTIKFLNLASTSSLINKGLNVGLPYMGSAPDLGAFEMK